MAESATRPPIRLVLVEDDQFFRELMRLALDSLPGIHVVADFRDAGSAEREIPALAPDVVVLDIDLGKASKNGVQLGLALRQALPQLGILLFSNHREPEFLLSVPSHEAGGWSYLLKSPFQDIQTLERAIRGSAAGLVTLDPRLTASIDAPVVNGATLTPRQQQLLQLMAHGYSNRAIADELSLSLKTVENTVGVLYGTLGIDSGSTERHARVQATRMYLASVRT